MGAGEWWVEGKLARRRQILLESVCTVLDRWVDNPLGFLEESNIRKQGIPIIWIRKHAAPAVVGSGVWTDRSVASGATVLVRSTVLVKLAKLMDQATSPRHDGVDHQTVLEKKKTARIDVVPCFVYGWGGALVPAKCKGHDQPASYALAYVRCAFHARNALHYGRVSKVRSKTDV